MNEGRVRLYGAILVDILRWLGVRGIRFFIRLWEESYLESLVLVAVFGVLLGGRVFFRFYFLYSGS